MRITSILLTAFCLNVAAKGHTQGISFSGREVPLKTVFAAIEKQAGYVFFYDAELLNSAKPVTVNVKNATVDELLKQAFKNQPLDYTIKEKTIFVIARKESPNEKELTTDHSPLTIAPPPIDITGRVTDADGNPLSGATVKVKGTNKGTTTNNDGVFVLKGVDDNAVLEISFVGYEMYTVRLSAASGAGLGIIALKVKPESLNEVVINKGYYTEKQRLSVSNVGKVTARDIEKQPVNNPLLALQGRVPGIFITQNNGLPGGGITVRIEGQNSFLFGNDPFYVIDGVPYFSQFPLTGNESVLGNSGAAIGGYGGGNPLSYLNLSDIESIEVLKDADATAIYGSRAANGAILITTKKGKVGSTKVDFNFQQGWGQVANHLNMMNSRQYLDMRREALRNDNKTVGMGDYDLNGVWDTTHYTDWQKVLIGSTAHYTDANASISGGGTAMEYLIGTKYHRETAVFPGDFENQTGSVHFVINSHSTNQKLSVQLTGNYLFGDNRLPNVDLTERAIKQEPIAPSLYNADGTLNWAPDATGTSTLVNPLKYLYNTYRNKTKNLVSNMLVVYKLLPGLQISSSVGYTDLQTNDFTLTPSLSIAPENRSNTPRSARFGNRNMHSWNVEPQLTYERKISNGKLSALLGTTIQQQQSSVTTISGSNYNNDRVLEDISAAPIVTVGGSLFTAYKYNALFTRINYALKDKYIINLTGRRDGSSRFGPKSRFHNFGSAGAAWIFTQEEFMKNRSLLSFGKLRGSYGTTGNDQIGDYTYMNPYVLVGGAGIAYQGISTLMNQGVANPYLEWEETKKIQVGLDLGLFKDKVVLNTTFVRNRSSNQLLGVAYPNFTAANGITANFPATIQNSSWEFSIQSSNVSSKYFDWRTNVNVTIPRNKLVAFPGLESSGYNSTLVIGQPITTVKRFSFAGVDPTTGEYQFFDASGAKTLTPNYSTDLTALINTLPQFYGGFQNTFSFKGFELDILFQFVKQKGTNLSFWNGSFFPGQFAAGFSNQPVEIISHWMKPGDETSFSKYSTNSNNYLTASTYSYTNASYVRLKNLSLSYQLPNAWLKKLRLQSCRIYSHGQNLATITDYKGLDPETQSNNTLPPLRVITVGLQIVM